MANGLISGSKLDRWTNFCKRNTVIFLKGLLYGSKRNDELFKNIKTVPERLENSNKVNFTAKIQKRDSVTSLTRSTLWPRIHIA